MGSSIDGVSVTVGSDAVAVLDRVCDAEGETDRDKEAVWVSVPVGGAIGVTEALIDGVGVRGDGDAEFDRVTVLVADADDEGVKPDAVIEPVAVVLTSPTMGAH